MMTNVMVKTCLNQKIIKNSNLIQAMKNSLFPTANITRRPIFFESRICPNIYRMFRRVEHRMIIVKWHLFIWHERLCALTNAPPVQSTQMGQYYRYSMNCSAAQVYVLHPGQSKLHMRRPFLKFSESRIWYYVPKSTDLRTGYFEKFFVFQMLWWMCLNQKIIKISNLIQAMKNSVCPAKVMRRPKFSESRICPNIYRMFRSVDWTHDMILI